MTDQDQGALVLATAGAAPIGSRKEALLARIVEPETMVALQEAHDQFFGALADPALTVPERAVLAAHGTVALKAALRPLVGTLLMPLMNTAQGFDTDRNPAKSDKAVAPYGEETVLDCAVTAWLQGLPAVGNCWNIIASTMYPRKEGFETLLSRVCRFTPDVKMPALPQEIYDNGGYLRVPVVIQYKLHGAPEDEAPQRFSGSYSVRVNRRNAVAIEACEGKAKRKAYRDLWQVISGILLPDADDPDGPVIHQVGAHFGATGKKLSVDDGKPEAEEKKKADPKPIGKAAIKALEDIAKEVGLDPETFDELVAGVIGTGERWGWQDVTADQYAEIEAAVKAAGKGKG